MGRVETRLKIGRSDAPGVAGNMATAASAPIRPETLEERVCLIDAPGGAVGAQRTCRISGIQRVGPVVVCGQL